MRAAMILHRLDDDAAVLARMLSLAAEVAPVAAGDMATAPEASVTGAVHEHCPPGWNGSPDLQRPPPSQIGHDHWQLRDPAGTQVALGISQLIDSLSGYPEHSRAVLVGETGH
jgi:hypothetical protein